MIITLKTLQEDAFTVEIDPLQSVRIFKEKIEKVKGPNFPAKYMKLIYAGKYLQDGNRVCDYNLEEKKFVILVVKEPKKEAVNVVGTPSQIDLSFLDDIPFDSIEIEEHEEEFLRERDHHVQRISELGFPRDAIERALYASYNNPDLAVEYLYYDCENVLDRYLRREPEDSDDPRPDIPESRLLRHIAQVGHPNSSNSILPSHERIFELFSEAVTECENENREEDRRIEANHEHIFESYAELDAAGITDPHGIFSDSGLECTNSSGSYACASPRAIPTVSYPEFLSDRCDSLQVPGSDELGNLLDRDQEAINRLKQLGFSDQKVIEAYFVCEKNENAAADYLFKLYE